jgi:hypothetical protein
MGQILHGSATTTEAIRFPIYTNEIKALTFRHGPRIEHLGNKSA